MNIPRTVALVFVGLLLHGRAQALERPSSTRQQDRCFAVQIEAVGSTSDEQTHGRRHRVRQRFSARDVLDLRFRVLLPSQNQSGLIEVKLYTPKGKVYETLSADLDPDSSSEGMPRYRFRRARTVTADLPVAGTFITRRSLFGEWRAEVYLDGNERPCMRATTFTLEP
jgi:hypothetical protein